MPDFTLLDFTISRICSIVKTENRAAGIGHQGDEGGVTTAPPLPACLQVRGKDRFWLAIKAQPRAHRTELAGLLGAELRVRVAAPPVDNAANEALLRFLAELLGLARASVRLVRGQRSAHKVFEVSGLTAREAAPQLGLTA